MTSIGLDLDGTLFDSLTPMLEEYNLRYNKRFKHSDITDYKAHRILNIKHEEFLDILNHVWINNYQEIQPYEKDVYKDIDRLRANGFEVLIVTRRDFKTIFSAVNSLKRWRIVVDGFVCLNNELDKTIVDLDFMIDDHKDVINAFGKKRGYLLKRSYNKEYDIESIHDFTEKLLNNDIEIPCRIEGFTIGAGT